MVTKLRELTIYRPDGSTQVLQYQDKPDLKELQSLVGGYIEFVRLPRGNGHKVMVVNDEGRLQKRLFNCKASLVAKQAIVGVAVVY